VQEGQLLFRLDPEPFRIAVERAQANLATVRMEVDSRRNLEIARQNAAASRAGAMGAAASYDRDPNLPINEHPAVMQAQAQLDQARLDMSYATVRAPATGTIANFDLRPGVYVRAGTPMFTLVAAQPLWIEANFKETDLTHVRIGQLATVTADAFPGRVIHARVSSINPGTGSEFSLLPPQNASGNWVKVVQRLPVRLVPLDLDHGVSLRAGMSVTAEIDTGFLRPVLGLFHSKPQPPTVDETQPGPPPQQAAPEQVTPGQTASAQTGGLGVPAPSSPVGPGTPGGTEAGGPGAAGALPAGSAPGAAYPAPTGAGTVLAPVAASTGMAPAAANAHADH